MNKTLKFLFLAAIVVAAGCNKDDDSSASLAGEWRMTDLHSDDGLTYIDILGTQFPLTFMYHGTAYNTITTFTENPNEFTSTGSYTLEYTSNFGGIQETETQVVDAFAGTGQWEISGDTLYQTFAGVTTPNIILEKTSSKLRLRQDLDTNIGGSPTTATVFSTFEKN